MRHEQTESDRAAARVLVPALPPRPLGEAPLILCGCSQRLTGCCMPSAMALRQAARLRDAPQLVGAAELQPEAPVRRGGQGGLAEPPGCDGGAGAPPKVCCCHAAAPSPSSAASQLSCPGTSCANRGPPLPRNTRKFPFCDAAMEPHTRARRHEQARGLLGPGRGHGSSGGGTRRTGTGRRQRERPHLVAGARAVAARAAPAHHADQDARFGRRLHRCSRHETAWRGHRAGARRLVTS
jgi:hypothetical protein